MLEIVWWSTCEDRLSLLTNGAFILFCVTDAPSFFCVALSGSWLCLGLPGVGAGGQSVGGRVGDCGVVQVSLLFCTRPRLAANVPSIPRLIPGYPSLDSSLAMGVAVGSMETAERTGKTRLIEPGLTTSPALFDPVDVEKSFLLLAPENILTDDSRGAEGAQPCR